MTSDFLRRRGCAAALATAALFSVSSGWADNTTLLTQSPLPAPVSALPDRPQKAGSISADVSVRSPGAGVMAGDAPADERPTHARGRGYFSAMVFDNFWLSLGLLLSLVALALAAWALQLASTNRSRLKDVPRLKDVRKLVEAAVSETDDAADRRGADHHRDIQHLRQELLSALRERAPVAGPQNIWSATSDQLLAPHPGHAGRPVRAPEEMALPQVQRSVSPAALNAEVLSCIEQLAKAGNQITEANAAVRIISSSQSEQLKQGLQTANLSVSFYTAAGDASAINVELLAWRWSDQEAFQVVPHPHAGRVGQFNKWFDLGSGDYGTQPVLASRPATAQLVNQKLVPATLGTLR